MFPTYQIYQPGTQNSVTICKLSYVCAALFGIFYFAIKAGRIRFVDAAGLNLLCLLGLAGLLLVTSTLPAREQVLAMLVMTPAVLAFQSVKMVRLVMSSYRRRAWIVQQDD